ncbi:MAG: glycosyltransferase [Flavobacteriales bacterium]|nr:glycosyltransferase [Flavobacteriales bacterium]
MRNEEPSMMVSVVMPSYRMGSFIQGALGSVGSQSYPSWELIVVDDHGPEDGTRVAVAAFAARFPRNRVEFIRHEHNQGVAAARNTGASVARGRFLAFLDPDDDWMPIHLERLLALLETHAGSDVAAGPVEIFSDQADGPPSRVSALGGWQRRFFPHTLALYNFIQPSAALIRAEAFQRVGGFDPDRAIQHIEDYDLWIRMVSAGCRFAFLEQPTSRYRQHAAGATSDADRMRELDDRLRVRHQAFFSRSQAWILRSLLKEASSLRSDLTAMRIASNGPVMRMLLALDRGLRRAYHAFRK